MLSYFFKDLTDLAQLYFKSNPPVVEWKGMKYSGLADNEYNKISLAPDIKHTKPWPIDIGFGLYPPRTKLKLSEYELYFQVLLYEIGHFKVTLKPPR
mgnify:CR=1 FL=1